MQNSIINRIEKLEQKEHSKQSEKEEKGIPILDEAKPLFETCYVGCFENGNTDMFYKAVGDTLAMCDSGIEDEVLDSEIMERVALKLRAQGIKI